MAADVELAAMDAEESDEDVSHSSVGYINLGVIVTATPSESVEDWTTPRSSYSQATQVDGAEDAFSSCPGRDLPSAPPSPAMSPQAPPLSRQRRAGSWPLPPPEQEHLLEPSLSRPSAATSCDEAPQSPSNVWLAEPTSIDEPLLLLDGEEEEISEANTDATVARLRQDLYEVRHNSKADRAEMEELASSAEEAQRKHAEILTVCGRLHSENTVLRRQNQNHHGIMAAEWGQTLGFQERLRQEEAAGAQLAEENRDLREGIAARSAEQAALREDAAHWRLLCGTDSIQDTRTTDLDSLLEAAMPGISRIHTELHSRSRVVSSQLTQELENRLCVVCRDAEKAILFKPCLHVCVCERCRGRLRPYRCPICQEPVREHIGRVHF